MAPLKTIKMRSQDVIPLNGSNDRDGFLATFYDIGADCVGTVRTVHGVESRNQILRMQVPVVMMSAAKQAEVDEEWRGGIKVCVVGGTFDGYVGYMKVRTR